MTEGWCSPALFLLCGAQTIKRQITGRLVGRRFDSDVSVRKTLHQKSLTRRRCWRISCSYHLSTGGPPPASQITDRETSPNVEKMPSVCDSQILQ
ncbi:hypothetical protein Q8A67_006436 [Cirrhinus molitorella]|uniref:Uncharacterized protein n=1 Tax=Cirrhinus molitorella TaxID=172907 RepID=A0AA88Q269_9TELE|nr:hypothetical protein Q8A67_006436 [Cirrhinus molitorella]